jgi:hypothetical protein
LRPFLVKVLLNCPLLTYLTGPVHLAAMSYRLALTASLGAFVVFTATSLSEDTILLYFAVKPLESDLKRVARVYLHIAHSGYQRDLRSLERPLPDPRDW